MRLSASIIFILLCSIPLFSQNQIVIKGSVIDAENKEPLPYSNIGIIGSSIGTISSPTGNFQLYLNDNATQIIRFSFLGYASQDLSIKELTKVDSFVISLKRDDLILSTVEVTPRFVNTKTIGHKKNTPARVTNFAINKKPNQNLGASIGRKFKIKEAKAFLESFNFYIAKNNFSEVRFRINIYELQNGKPQNNIHNKDIIVAIEKEVTGWINVDLKPYNIKAKQNIMIAIEWIYHSPKGTHLSLPISLPTICTHFYKYGSQDKWKRFRGMSTAMTLCYGY